MIKNIPSSADFFTSGKELLDFAWDTVATLLTDLNESTNWGIEEAEVSSEYWFAARRKLTTALAITQQGVEFILKGKIAEISPYLLLADPPSRWPSPYEGCDIEFSEFKTADAQDLIRLHDVVAASPLSSTFTERFHSLREKRNIISHSIDKKLTVHTAEVLRAILAMHKALLPSESWAKVRGEFIDTSPGAVLDGGDFSTNIACRELETVLNLLTPAEVLEYFGFDKKQQRYLCPECLYNANKDTEFEHKLAVLKPKGAMSTTLYCPVCDVTHAVVREDCPEESCPGNVIGDKYAVCLTCGC